MLITEALTYNTSLTHSERMELFLEILEPRWQKEWKSMKYNPLLCLKFFSLLRRLEAYDFEWMAKAYNGYATSKKISNIDLMVSVLRNGKNLQGELTSFRQTVPFDNRRH